MNEIPTIPIVDDEPMSARSPAPRRGRPDRGPAIGNLKFEILDVCKMSMESDPMNTPGRVLIIDDEPNVRLTFRTALESAGYTVSEAADGERGLMCLQEFPADLILLDLRMPNVDGMDVLRLLRDAGDATPVVMVTAHGSIPDAVEAMRLGAVDFLSKPLTPEALRTVAADVIRRHAPTEPAPATDPAAPPAVAVGPLALDLMRAKRALNLRDFAEASRLLGEALDLDPHSAEAHTLLGILQEGRGQDHAAFHSYRAALMSDRRYKPALDNLWRYCQRFGLDFQSRAINPATEGRAGLG